MRYDPAFAVFIRPHIWRCRMRNGAELEVSDLFRRPRKLAREALLTLANGDYGDVYHSTDIESMWEARH